VPRTNLNAVKKRKISCPCPKSNPRLSYSVSSRFDRKQDHGTMVLLTSSCLTLHRWESFNYILYVFTCLLTAQRQSRSEQRKESKDVHTIKYNIIERFLAQPQACFRSSSAVVSKFLLRYITGQSGRLLPIFRRDISPQTSTFVCCLLNADPVLRLLFKTEVGGSMLLRNIGRLSSDYTACYSGGRNLHKKLKPYQQNLNHSLRKADFMLSKVAVDFQLSVG
jgi:hypothetical protein